MNRRITINLAAFAVVSTVVIAWSFATLFEIDVLDDPDFVTAEFASSPGLARGFEVAYLGHAIGSIHSVELHDGRAEVVLRIDKGTDLPAEVHAAARRKSAIGEPFIDLSPAPGIDPDAGPRLGDGDRIPLDRTSSPVNYGTLFRRLEELLGVIEPDRVGVVVGELATALDGRGDDLRRIIAGSRALTSTLVDNGDQIERFLVDVRDLTGVLATERDSLAAGIDALDQVTAVLDENAGHLDQLLTEAPSGIQVVARIVAETDAQLVCTVDGLAVLGPITDDGVAEQVRALIADSGTALAVTEGAIGDDGYLNLTLLLSDTSGAAVYPERRPPPAIPEVAGCPDLTGPSVATPVGRRAEPGPGGRTGLAADGSGGPDRRPDDAEQAGRRGSSELDPPDDPLLARLLRIALPVVVLAVLGALAWWVWRHRREPEQGTADGPAPIDEQPDEPAER